MQISVETVAFKELKAGDLVRSLPVLDEPAGLDAVAKSVYLMAVSGDSLPEHLHQVKVSRVTVQASGEDLNEVKTFVAPGGDVSYVGDEDALWKVVTPIRSYPYPATLRRIARQLKCTDGEHWAIGEILERACDFLDARSLWEHSMEETNAMGRSHAEAILRTACEEIARSSEAPVAIANTALQQADEAAVAQAKPG